MNKKKILKVKSEPEKKPTKEDLLGVKIEPEKRLTKEEWYVDDPEALMRSMPRKKAKFVKVEKPTVKEEVAANAQAEVKEEPQAEVKEELPPPAAAAEVKEEAPGIQHQWFPQASSIQARETSLLWVTPPRESHCPSWHTTTPSGEIL